MSSVPGVVISNVSASTRSYVGSPSIAILPNGGYLASHDLFGPGATNDTTFIYRSIDRGCSWNHISTVTGQVWSSLFLHGRSLYILGTDHCDRYDNRLNGAVVIRKSDDGGETWTDVYDVVTGLLTDQDGWHCAPVPVIRHTGRLWRAFEFAPEPDRRTWQAFVLSIEDHADLLDRRNWRISEPIDHLWSNTQWIEGNMVVAPDGSSVNLLRVNDQPNEKVVDKAAIVRVTPDGTLLSHDPQHDLIDFPGGGTKFTVRRDSDSCRYISLVNIQSNPRSYRNRLYLTSSEDLHSWDVHARLLYHPDDKKHAFQYVDWVFEGGDIIYLSRTAYDDNTGGAERAHNANFLTFHRISDFRSMMKNLL